ncbi:phosphate ABC transporter substrate-binding protein PstS [Raineyella sp. W15-4]|uniref:phosphate ABC transporter substrate-binding protein PstS n=1 Tax=Raineyella sp. W15-4 TaxID=3081651 RepID=UPI0029540CF9|nr:phosphate ABC transporter substrate-binding protein PstS [Raineyella sp. W15-4]WOQ18178.1 phosphate ABC transporter substrate-binding protein PstS [Raineyella sp. W15-4]
MTGERRGRATNARHWTTKRTTALLLGVAMMMLGVFGTIAPPQAAAVGTTYVPITGSGSTWSENALAAWIRNVWGNHQWKIEYSGGGSTQGRTDFANGTKDFGVSEIPYGIANSNEADRRPERGFAYMPIVAGGTAFMYNLSIGGKRVTNLRLSGDTVAKIFTGVITRWNDPAISADNPQLALPNIPIVPVVRSDGSGATAQVSIWLRQEHTAVWDAYCPKVGRPMVNGHCGVTSNYPTVPGSGFISKKGSEGVSGYVAQSYAAGAITFVEYSYALNSGFPVAKLLNSGGYYTEPTAANVAVGLLQAHINEDQTSPDYLTQDLRDVYTNKDTRTYPLSSYSYIILPTKLEFGFTENKGKTLGAFGSYFLCDGQRQAEVLGYSPMPVNLVLGAQRQLKKVQGGDPAETGFAVKDCNNPTLDPNDPNGNALAKGAPFPKACDKQGPVQCSDGTGGAKDTSTAPSSGGGAQGTTGGGGQAGSSAAGGPGGAAGGSADASGVGSDGLGVDELSGSGAGVNARPAIVAANPQSIPAPDLGLSAPAALLLGGAGIVLATVAPPLLSRRRKRLLPGAVPGSVSLTRGSPLAR